MELACTGCVSFKKYDTVKGDSPLKRTVLLFYSNI